MIQYLFAIYDKKAELVVRNVIFVSSTHAAAKRMFEDIVAVKESEIGAHPEDYDFLYLGELHLEECRVDGVIAPRMMPVMTALGVLKDAERKINGREMSEETVDMFDDVTGKMVPRQLNIKGQPTGDGDPIALAR